MFLDHDHSHQVLLEDREVLLLAYFLERPWETLAFSLRFARAVDLVVGQLVPSPLRLRACVAFVRVALLGRRFRVVLSSRGTWTGPLCPLVGGWIGITQCLWRILDVFRAVIDNLPCLW